MGLQTVILYSWCVFVTCPDNRSLDCTQTVGVLVSSLVRGSCVTLYGVKQHMVG